MKPTTASLAFLVLSFSASDARPFSPTEALAAKGNPKGGIDNWLLEGAHPFLTRIGNNYYMLTTRCKHYLSYLFCWTVGKGVCAVQAVLHKVLFLNACVLVVQRGHLLSKAEPMLTRLN